MPDVRGGDLDAEPHDRASRMVTAEPGAAAAGHRRPPQPHCPDPGPCTPTSADATTTPATATSWPPNARSAPASAARGAPAGVDALSRPPPDQPNPANLCAQSASSWLRASAAPGIAA